MIKDGRDLLHTLGPDVRPRDYTDSRHRHQTAQVTPSQTRARDQFINFCQEAGLEKLTNNTLDAHGCGSMLALGALKQGDIDKLNLPLGQQRLLEIATNHEPSAPVCSTQYGYDQRAETNSAKLDQLGISRPNTATMERAFLGIDSTGTGNIQYHDIVNFVDVGIYN